MFEIVVKQVKNDLSSKVIQNNQKELREIKDALYECYSNDRKDFLEDHNRCVFEQEQWLKKGSHWYSKGYHESLQRREKVLYDPEKRKKMWSLVDKAFNILEENLGVPNSTEIPF